MRNVDRSGVKTNNSTYNKEKSESLFNKLRNYSSTAEFLVNPEPDCRIRDIYHLIKRLQRASTGLVEGLRGLTYEGRLKTLKIPSLEN